MGRAEGGALVSGLLKCHFPSRTFPIALQFRALRSDFSQMLRAWALACTWRELQAQLGRALCRVISLSLSVYACGSRATVLTCRGGLRFPRVMHEKSQAPRLAQGGYPTKAGSSHMEVPPVRRLGRPLGRPASPIQEEDRPRTGSHRSYVS